MLVLLYNSLLGNKTFQESIYSKIFILEKWYSQDIHMNNYLIKSKSYKFFILLWLEPLINHIK